MNPGRAATLVAIAAVTIGMLLIAGCGGGDENNAERRQDEAKVEKAVQSARLKALLKVKVAESKRRRENPGEVLAPTKYQGALAERYEFDREVCSALPSSEMAASLGIDEDSDPEAIAEAYSKAFPGRFRQPSFEGCLAGLE